MIEEGLKPGEKVIIDGLQRVRPGSVVDPKPADMRSRPGGTDAGKSPVAAEADSDGGPEKQHSPSKPAEKH